MTNRHELNYPYEVTWEEAAQEVTALLGDEDWEATCPWCQQLAQQARNTPDGTSPRDYLEDISQVLSVHPGPGAGQAGQEDCDYDLHLAQRAAALGKYQLHWTIEWGPGHSPEPHPSTWQACPICTQWVKDRQYAREHLRQRGVDDTSELGPSDTPTW